MRKVKKLNSQKGFTLIELLTVVVTIGVLASLSMGVFHSMRTTAAHGASVQAVMNARTALESSLTNPDLVVPSVDYEQNTPGPITDASAALLFPGFQNSSSMLFYINHDPTCEDETCEAEVVTISHCKAEEHAAFYRYGDGVEVILEHLPGGGCA
jgi:prepilin-type N-terminal cleavage/methylation domain-containing protein